MLRKMITQLSLALALFGGLALTAFQTPVAHAQTPQTTTDAIPYCQIFDEGKVSVTLTEGITLVAVSFIPEFCDIPSVFVIRGHDDKFATRIEVGVVTTKVAWFVIYGPEGQKVDFSWQARAYLR